jgi:peptidyl-prolyl cis-trans isomerase D
MSRPIRRFLSSGDYTTADPPGLRATARGSRNHGAIVRPFGISSATLLGCGVPGNQTMTMLDRMRRHKGWLKWSLALVILTFAFFFVPNNGATTAGGISPEQVLADVNGEAITVAQFQRRYGAQLQAYRNAYGGQISEQMLRQLGIDQQILQSLVDEQAVAVEARRQNLRVTDVEVRQRILSLPGLMENGVFIGETRYRQLLSNQNPPLSTREFEDQLRSAILQEKLRTSVTGWMSVPDADVAAEYRRRNEKVKLELVNLTADGFRSQVAVTPADIQARFDANKETYRIGEKRKVRYALVEVDKVRERVQVPEADIQAFYDQNKAQYTTEGRVRASHILLKTEGKDEAAVKAKAEDLLKQARGGADFAALAKANSEDEGSAVNGGDLNYFGRGQMVPEFEQAAFALKAGEISDVIKTSFGFHIIKVVESQPETTRPLAEVSPEIVDQLRWQKAQQQAEQDGKAMEAAIKSAADLDRVAKERGLALVDSPFFLRDEPIGELGASPDLASRAFSMKDGEVTPALRVTRGWVIATPAGTQASYLPQLAEVSDRVRDDVVREKAADLVKQRGQTIADELKKAADFTAAAKKAGFEAKASELVARGGAFPDIGVNAALESAVFGLPVGGVAGPVPTPTGSVIARVAERADVTEAQITEGRDALREELVNQQRDRFFMAYMAKAKTNLKIEVKQDLLTQLMGPMPAPPSFPAPAAAPVAVPGTP